MHFSRYFNHHQSVIPNFCNCLLKMTLNNGTMSKHQKILFILSFYCCTHIPIHSKKLLMQTLILQVKPLRDVTDNESVTSIVIIC